MNMTAEQNLPSKLKTLSAQQVAEVEDFLEFLVPDAPRLTPEPGAHRIRLIHCANL